MKDTDRESDNEQFWFLDTRHGWDNDDIQRFFNDSCWFTDKENDRLKLIEVGDKLALKSTVPRDEDSSALTIMATGVVTYNPLDGRSLDVDWSPLYDQPREWHSRLLSENEPVIKINTDGWMNESLVSFAFGQQGHFRNARDYWRDRCGWTTFYSALAVKLLQFKHDREDLVNLVHKITRKVYSLPSFLDDSRGQIYAISDICPFTVMGMLNRDMPDKDRTKVAKEFAAVLDIDVAPPVSFEGIPIVHHTHCVFFSKEQDRDKEDMNRLWELFHNALIYSQADATDGDKSAFAVSYDRVLGQSNIDWNLTLALFWVAPWHYPSLDLQTQTYIKGFLKLPIRQVKTGNICSSRTYLNLMRTLQNKFLQSSCPVHSFPELSLMAWLFESQDRSANTRAMSIDLEVLESMDRFEEGNMNESMDLFWVDPLLEKTQSVEGSLFTSETTGEVGGGGSGGMAQGMEMQVEEPEEDPEKLRLNLAIYQDYSIRHIMEEGCFVPEADLSIFLERLASKKNLILQGPPGTGKTWLARKLAFALVELKADPCVRSVEFHSNITYEDFIRGWRPSAGGGLQLIDGPFLEMIHLAEANPETPIVLIIEEINRGNPTRIFGDMMTLLEADKRNNESAMELSYRKAEDERVFIPENLHIVGTMNISDRSLSMIDIALRRRFAFIELAPSFGKVWEDWVHKESRIERRILKEIEKRMVRLNEVIAEDEELGEQFRIGHSYVTPSGDMDIKDPVDWFKQVAKTEIGPLLQEYWFDNREKAKEEYHRLIEGL